MDTMVNHPDPRSIHGQQGLNLLGGKLRDGDDEIAALRRVARLLGESRPKLLGGVIAGQDEQIVKGGDRVLRRFIHALVERVKDRGGGRTVENPAGHVVRKSFAEGRHIAVGAVVEKELLFGVLSSQAEQDFARIDSDSGEISSQAIGRVESNHWALTIFQRLLRWVTGSLEHIELLVPPMRLFSHV